MIENFFHPVFTDAGRAAAADDTGQGLKTLITHVVMGDGKYAVRDANGLATDAGLEATALQNELLRVPVYTGGSPSAGMLNLTAQVTKAGLSDPKFYISEVGFLDADGVLLAVWSSASANLGYRGDVMTWYLSLGLAWVDLPGDQFAVQVQNGPLAQQTLLQAQLRGQVADFVSQSGVEYLDDDMTALSRAMDLRINNIVESLDKSIRTPIAVTPANNAVGVVIVPTLVGSDYFSADGYEFISAQFRIYDELDNLVVDSGELSAVTEFAVQAGSLETLTGYSWEVAYKGQLGEVVLWSDFSDRVSFTTADQYIAAPTVISPTDGALSIGETPTITLSAFNAVNGVDTQVSKRVQVASDSGFVNIVWDSGEVAPGATIVIPEGILLEGENTYFARGSHTGQNFGASAWSATSQFTTKDIFAYNSAPALIAPADLATNVARRPTLTISAYGVTPAGFDVVDAVQYQVYDDAEMTNLVWDSGVLTSNFTSVQVGIDLPLDTQHYWTARHRGDALGWTDYAAAITFTTTAAAPGAIMEDGGIVVGQHDGYWLICAPASMRGQNIRHGLYGTDTTLTNITSAATPDPQSGYDNTNTLINNYGSVNDGQGSIGPVAAQFCRDQGANYYLPNKDELSIIVAAAATIDANDQTSGITFASMSTNYIWSSTEYSSTGSWIVRASDGVVHNGSRNDDWFVVPVRRMAV